MAKLNLKVSGVYLLGQLFDDKGPVPNSRSCVGYGSAFFEVTLSPVETCLYTIAILWICTFLGEV